MLNYISLDQSQVIIFVKIQYRKCGNHTGHEEPKKSNGLMLRFFTTIKNEDTNGVDGVLHYGVV